MSSHRFFATILSLLAIGGCATGGSAAESKTAARTFTAISETREACRVHFDAVHRKGAQALSAEIAQFQYLAEQALSYRQITIEIANRLLEKLDAGEPLSGDDLELLREGMHDYLEMRQQLWAVAEAHECWMWLPDAALEEIGIGTEQRGDAVMLSLSAALLLYDNYLLATSLYEQDTKLRRILNQRDSGFGLAPLRLTEMKLQFLSVDNRDRMGRAIGYFRARIEPLLESDYSPERRYLYELIVQSPTYSALRHGTLPAEITGELGTFRMLSFDLLSRMSREGVSLFSMLFGNTMGLVETRRGRLYRKSDVEQALAQRLEAGDILLEKTPFRLTDLLIPGYWGHAAIWVGSETELRELGIWDHPVVRPHHDAIRAGRKVVEALRSGVKLNTLGHFLNVDDLLVLRPAHSDRVTQGARVVRAFRQVGKAYDFNFDVESTDRIVCSELIYQVYTEMTWPTSRTLGRATISPDQVARKALDGGPLGVVAFYQAGRPVDADPLARLQRALKSAPLE
jgi:hypothetical protein